MKMKMKMFRPVFQAIWALMFVVVPVLVPPVSVLAQSKIALPNFDPDSSGEWKEDKFSLPPPPAAENLLSFSVSTSNFSFWLDRQALSSGQDNIARYTLVMVSAQGARNVTYEGMRCATAERQTYAFGKPDGSWLIAREPRWQHIRDSQLTRHHFELLNGILCRNSATLSTTETLQILKTRLQ